MHLPPIPAANDEDYMVNTNPLVVTFGTGPNDVVSHGDLIGSTSTPGTVTILDDSILEEAEDLSVVLFPLPPSTGSDTSTITICDDEGKIITCCCCIRLSGNEWIHSCVLKLCTQSLTCLVNRYNYSACHKLNALNIYTLSSLILYYVLVYFFHRCYSHVRPCLIHCD